ncbi:MAG: DUF1566 domain-containing protein [Candidatus Binatia bacterium]
MVAQTCVGDCKGVGRVEIGDLITGVNIVLGSLPASACEAFQNAQGGVDVAQLIQGVNNALAGCPEPPGRFVDQGDGTIADRDTGLIWEKKDQAGGLHEARNTYVWAGRCSDDAAYCQPDAVAEAACAAATGGARGCALCAGSATCDTERGLATIWQWLSQLNAERFAGHSDWRIPNVEQDGAARELETIVDTTVAGCGSTAPCVPRAFDRACAPGCTVSSCSCTLPEFYWSATSLALSPDGAWEVYFYDGSQFPNFSPKQFDKYVRAVRGGS